MATASALVMTSTSTSSTIAKHGCKDRCGNVSIPYPFGIGSSNCYYDKTFEISCAGDSPNNSYPKIGKSYKVLQITLDYVRIDGWAPPNCYNNESGMGQWDYAKTFDDSLTNERPFTFSNTHNKLTAVGCDIFAYIPSKDSQNYSTGCASLCGNETMASNSSSSSSCFGRNGCCQTSIPKGLKNFELLIQSINTNNRSWIHNPCSYAFLVDNEYSGFESIHQGIHFFF
ncbi:Wall-associated receptor kinase galacturonan-binding domain [Macleaya cordata]|uniref:Wall-associated receptor kinase galacturonan-binding domain n=1 Tax=Macleaya cordata TaxID=56857 RepID=A0A200RAM8_MACCD|nr:Wall-associated receptor kinase galacturonan-binding domain [Macleaya cordata]